jgi:hypothetical protein
LLLALLPGGARADSLNLQLEPSYGGTRTSSTDAAGNTTHLDTTEFRQRYRLSLDRQLFPLVRLGGNGLYDWTLDWQKADGAWSQVDARRWSAGLRLDVGGPILRGGAQYDIREQSSESRSAGVTSAAPTLEQRIATLYAAWRAEDLPWLDLRLSRTDSYDKSRAVIDTTTDEGALQARYQPVSPLEVRATLQYLKGENRLADVTQTDTSGLGRVQYADTFLGDRLSLNATYDVQRTVTDIAVAGTGGVILERRLPATGLSLVEPLPATSVRSTLNANPALVDGDTAAAAGIDIGFGPSLSGDNNDRQIGARFADAVTDVNTVYLWVDQALPTAIAGAFSFTAWQSDDNLNWTQVNLAGPVVFGLLQNRFEITIETARARHLKVVVKPLLPAVTTDARYQAIRVTEIQFFLSSSAASRRGRQTTDRGLLSTGARVRLNRAINLVYDGSLYLVHGTRRPTTWDLVNGISASRRLAAALVGSARLERTDSEQGRGTEWAYRYSATLAADPIPAFGAAFNYSGEYGHTQAGEHDNNNFLLLARADLYRGLSLLANGSFAFGTLDTGQATRTLNANGSLQVSPGAYLTLTGTYLYQETRISAAGTSNAATSRLGRVEGTASFTPFPALYASASVARVVTGDKPYTLANFGANVAPFPGGSLLLRFSYQESLDTGADVRTRLWGPALRWNIRTGTYLDVSYTDSSSRTPAVDSRMRTIFASLLATLG